MVTKSVFTGVYFNLWVKVDNGMTLLVQDYQNVEVGDRIGLKIDFYEIHLMKVEDSEQPEEVRKIREDAKAAIEAEDEADENEKV